MDFKERLELEKKELQEKIDGLTAFVKGENINKIDPTQKRLLAIQLPAMVAYNEVLDLRIKLLNK